MKSVNIDGKQFMTLSGRRWYSLNHRCKEGGSEQKRNPSYIGCSNEFKSFDNFVEWSRTQVGYNCSYHLDKDLLVKGNKIYSESTCVFLPKSLNSILTNSKSTNKSLPIGVKRGKNLFQAQGKDVHGNYFYIGSYSSPEEAFSAYKDHKESVLKELAAKYKGLIDPRAYDALMTYQVLIDD